MIRSDRFLISQRPYAARLNTYRLNTSDGPNGIWHRGGIQAVWFRRRRGVTVACIGYLSGFGRRTVPADAVDFLTGEIDGRYGGTCVGRWDGTGYWGAEDPAVAAEHLAILRPMLTDYPGIPDGWDGWWRYPSTAELREMAR